MIKLRFGHFITTSSPWLGSGGQHSYFPEKVAPFFQDFLLWGLAQTGQDLFRENELLYKMATEERYLAPLRACVSRQVFGNAYRTDMLVPLSTGLFLCKKDDETRNHEQNHHYVIPSSSPSSSSSFIAASYTTDVKSSQSIAWGTELGRMCASLDSLGFTKHVVDLRSTLWKVPHPFLW
jgi:hypothetical protein